MRLFKIVPDHTNVDFLRWRTIALSLSILLTIASLALVAVRGLNLGVDFVGGQMVRVDFAAPPPLDKLREQIGALGLGEATIQQFGAPNQVSIRTSLPDGGKEAADAAANKLKAAVTKAYPDAKIGSVETVSGKVSGELIRSGILSLGLAMLAISIYIWFRFEWQFGVGSLFSLFHDVALTFGFFALTQLEFNLNIIAALLTIIGYSLNDTIVVYDRVRENMMKYRKMELIPLLNLSLNETLSRTIMTSGFMIITLTVLMLIGPEVIFGFSAAMLLGIFIGTYSSIYMACALLVWAKVRPDSFVKDKATNSAERISRDDGARV